MLEPLWPEGLQLYWRETPTRMFSVNFAKFLTAAFLSGACGGCCHSGGKGGWGWLRSFAGCLGLALVLVGGGSLRGGVDFCFSGCFCQYWWYFRFGWGAGRWGIIIWGFGTFLMIPNSLGFKLLGCTAARVTE